MEYFKYILCIIFGILVFLLSYHINSFSIGNQYDLDYIGERPLLIDHNNHNNVLKTMFDIIVHSNNICHDFVECQRTMRAAGGSCQINSLIGLYQTALGIPFSEEDHDYIESQGRYLSNNKTNLARTYDYLTNRESMRELLTHNHIKPNLNMKSEYVAITDYQMNHLYSLSLIMGGSVDAITGDSTPFFFEDDGVTEFEFGHNLLMFRTNYAGLKEFIDFLDGDYYSGHPVYDNLIETYQEVHEASNARTASGAPKYPNIDNIKSNGIVCILIDFCQKKFYAITEFSHLNTADYFDDQGNIPSMNLVTYTALWSVKIIIQYKTRWDTSFGQADGIVPLKFTPYGETEQITVNMLDLTITDLQQSPISAYGEDRFFIDNFRVKAFLNVNSDGIVEHLESSETPVFKDGNDFKGFENTLCLEPDDTCREDMYCHEDFQVNNGEYNVCKQLGAINNECRDSEPHCDLTLYCNPNDICEQKGELDTPCKDDPPQCNNDDLYCNSNDICKERGALSRFMRTCATIF